MTLARPLHSYPLQMRQAVSPLPIPGQVPGVREVRLSDLPDCGLPGGGGGSHRRLCGSQYHVGPSGRYRRSGWSVGSGQVCPAAPLTPPRLSRCLDDPRRSASVCLLGWLVPTSNPCESPAAAPVPSDVTLRNMFRQSIVSEWLQTVLTAAFPLLRQDVLSTLLRTRRDGIGHPDPPRAATLFRCYPAP
jgi:hypothetical protein